VGDHRAWALRWALLLGATGIAFCLAPRAFPPTPHRQPQDGSGQEELESFRKVLRDYPVPQDALKLDLFFSFPREEDLAAEAGLWGARYIETDEDGDLFVSDSRAGHILVFDRSGHFIRGIGEKGQGPGEFNSQRGMALDGERLIVNDTGNRRFQILSKNGEFINSFIVNKTYREMAAGHNGLIYAAPVRLQQSDPLVDVFDHDGKRLFSFGTGQKAKNWQQLDRIKIAVAEDDVFVVFVSLPILRSYSLRGELRNESNFGRAFMKEQERMNIARDRGGPPGRTAFIEIVQDLKEDHGNALVFIAHPRIEILELDAAGRVNRGWWAEKEFGRMDIAFAFEAALSVKRFFLLQGYPDNIVRVLEPSRRPGLQDLFRQEKTLLQTPAPDGIDRELGNAEGGTRSPSSGTYVNITI
jgi:hypothetical protein